MNRTYNPVIKSVWFPPISVSQHEPLWATKSLLDEPSEHGVTGAMVFVIELNVTRVFFTDCDVWL